ncbi:peptidase M23 [Apibacter muscae]|uniref:Peptidase M23 n=1 Tax=Apibacter muscae TaxID=2509004 RepID=A0A563DCH2_9FLAO|nr:peptidoglycan DD-metalloendopeptidase family protein [Apibacter muscae]TWP27769.1 peptidase M23 [Apibacter muscae]
MSIKSYFTLFTAVFLGCITYAQQPYKKENLQKESAKLRQEIVELNKALSISKNQSQSSLIYITNLNKKLAAREALINNTKKESKVLDDEIYLNQLAINKLRRELKDLREDYAEVLIRSYKNRSVQNKVLFILSSNDISQAFRRIKYLQKYSEYQNEKVAEIEAKQEAILKTIELREKAKKDKINILAQQQAQIKEINKDKKEKEAAVELYNKQQGDLLTKIKEKQTQRNALDRQVQAIIAEEMRIAKAKEAEERRKAELAELARRKTIEEERARKAREAELAAKKLAEEKAAAARKAAAEALAAKQAAEKEANEKARIEAEKIRVAREKAAEKAAAEKVAADKLAAEKAVKAKEAEKIADDKRASLGITKTPITNTETLSKNFEANKGRLPWPAIGTVVATFGTSPHPTMQNIKVDHKGVEIATSPGSLAKSVFEGTVSKVFAVPGGGKAVLVNHGNYFTLYANLSTAIVSAGDKVKIGQPLGKIYTDDANNTLLDFQIWQGQVPVNPANWISGM